MAAVEVDGMKMQKRSIRQPWHSKRKQARRLIILIINAGACSRHRSIRPVNGIEIGIGPIVAAPVSHFVQLSFLSSIFFGLIR